MKKLEMTQMEGLQGGLIDTGTLCAVAIIFMSHGDLQQVQWADEIIRNFNC
jgi:hypothetical protein